MIYSLKLENMAFVEVSSVDLGMNTLCMVSRALFTKWQILSFLDRMWI